MYTKKAFRILISIFGILLAGSALGAGYTPLDLQPFQLQPRANFWGFTGDNTRGEGQMLMPIYGNQMHAFFGAFDGNVAVNDTDWLAGAGLGFRQVVKSYILGAYVFADYLHSQQNNEYWVANPGLEMLGTKWDININGYLPVANKKHIQTAEAFATDLGIFQFQRLAGHNAYDHKLQGGQLGEEAGPGIDFEIGRVIPYFEQLRVYLGGYHFDFDNAESTNGIEARAIYEINKYVALEVRENNDNRNHNTFIAGLRFTLGGYSAREKEVFGISNRLMDPIDRDLVIGTLSNVVITPVNKIVDLGEVLVHDNVWLFKPLSAGANVAGNDIGPGLPVGSGTAEDPFVGFTPENYIVVFNNQFAGKLDPYPLMYFAPGVYNFAGFQSRSINGRFNLPNGWGMFGRTADYSQSAVDNDRALFDVSGLDLNYALGAGTAATTIDSIRVNNVGDSALFAANAQNIILRNSVLAAQEPLGFSAVVELNDSALSFVGGNNSIVGNTDALGTIIGIVAQTSILNFDGGDTNIFGTGGGTIGIIADGLTVNFNNGMNSIIGSARGTAFGITLLNSEVNFNGGSNIIDETGSDTATDIAMTSGKINFVGGVNKINGVANLSTLGLSLTDSIVTFTGGNTEFNLAASNIMRAIELKLSSTANFNSQAKVNFNLGNAVVDNFGIKADSSSSLTGNGADLTLPGGGANSFLNYMAFSGSFTGTQIDWDMHFTYP